jgi:NAD(P)-dependent dehydrogenase (short-subunit alcohol dehydrogenase family)
MEAIVKTVDADGRLAGRNALVTGGAHGLGAATAARMRAAGARVTVAEIHEGEGIVAADVTDSAAMARAVDVAAGDGRLDICVANAGVFAVALLVESGLDAWRRVIDVNLLGVAVTFQAATRRMIAGGGGGRLLATSSVAAWRSIPGGTAYCASKAAVIGLVRCLAAEVGQHGSR